MAVVVNLADWLSAALDSTKFADQVRISWISQLINRISRIH